MNLKEAKKLQPGAIVRESWMSENRTGLVIGKTHIVEDHTAKTLCQRKSQRYDVVVHWLDGPRKTWEYGSGKTETANPEVVQCWELMLVSSA